MTLPPCALRHRSEAPQRARELPLPRWLARLAVAAALAATVPAGAQAQTSSISGTVTDAANVPILAAQVSIPGTRNAAASDVNGRFRISGLTEPVGTAVTIVARRIGYSSATVQVHVGDENVAIHLTAAAVSLNEVVVTGTPGSTERRALGVDVAQIDASTLVQKAPIADVQQLLNGRSPGVTLLGNSGVIGAGSTVRIRGISSFSLTNQPLIYVDGVRVDNAQSTGTNNQGFGANTTTRWNDFNPDDIESIEIVKGPAATTLYGTEAANGVIQIITKKGAVGKTTYDFNMRQGANWFSNPQGRLWRNFDINADSDTVSQVYTDLQRAYGQPIFTTGHLQSYNMSVGGGTPLLRYHVSGGYDRNEGVESSNNLNNYNTRANLGIFPSDKFDIQANAAYIVGHTNLPCEAGCGGTTWTTYYSDPANIGTRHLGFLSGTPEAYHENYELFQAINRFTGGLTFNHRPADWFNQRLTLGVDGGNETSSELGGVHHDLSYFFDTDADSGYKVVNIRNTRVFTSSYVGNVILPVTSAIRSTTSLGGDIIKRDGEYVNGSGANFPAPGLSSLSSTTARQVTVQGDTLDNTVGVFGQEEIAWRDRVFLTAGVRLDNNSAFGKQFRNVFYPKVSGAWVLSEEPFFHLPQVTTLKLRAAYGQSGQSPLPYSSLATFMAVPGPFGAAVTPQSIGNPNLGPERAYETEFGFDAGLFHDRASIAFTYYFGGTKDAILQQQVAPSLGYPGTQSINAGRLTKHGFEVALTGTPVRSANTEWTLGLNLSTADTKVTDLNGAAYLQASQNVRHVVGFPVGSWFEKKVVGSTLDETTGKVTDVMCDDGTSAHNAVACADAPVVFLGRTLPNFEGSATSTLRFLKNFQLFVMLDSKTGYKKVDGNARVRCHLFDLCESNWFKSGVDPALLGAQSSGNFYSDIINDASFVKLREVSVSYSLPERFASAFRASGASISLAGRNLHTWTKYDGLDPEASFQGGSRGFGQWEQDVTPQLMQFVTTIHLTY
jgi:TonB-linked SusC/RagA family outer membrane protein